MRTGSRSEAKREVVTGPFLAFLSCSVLLNTPLSELCPSQNPSERGQKVLRTEGCTPPLFERVWPISGACVLSRSVEAGRRSSRLRNLAKPLPQPPYPSTHISLGQVERPRAVACAGICPLICPTSSLESVFISSPAPLWPEALRLAKRCLHQTAS